jgi:hypothetical protein
MILATSRHNLRLLIHKNNYMKILQRLITSLLLLTSINAYSLEVRLNSETSGSETASGVSFLGTATSPKSKQVFKYGVSFNHVSSNIALARNGRAYINPVYLFANFSLNYAVSPFFEAGVDLGDKFLNDLVDGDNRDVDFYYQFGLSFNINKTLNLSAYYKYYDIYFVDDPSYPYIIDEVNLSLTGVSLSYQF